MNQETIEKILDIYPPFLFVDKVIDKEIGSKIVTETKITKDSWFFESHLTKSPVMPGVLITEMMLQTSMLLIYKDDILKEDNRGFVHTFDVTLKRPITISECPIKLKTTSSLISSKRGISILESEVTIAGKSLLVSKGKIQHVIPVSIRGNIK